ncbi:MAG: glycosyltransferase family 4 protein [Verrucomicrobia bacterium]|nr:glycosyltransferase family 4 protein [Verrucomicrobiota bacterium]
MSSFAYLFERFPSFTQTFCYREVLEMRRQGVTAPIYSIRVPKDIPADCPEELAHAVCYLPEPDALAAEMKTFRLLGRYPWKVIQTLRGWGKRPDKGRLLAAAWLGKRLQKQGVRHVHAHFAGIAARTAYWIKAFYGITFSFTGHANDMFCETDFPVTLGDLVREAGFVVTEADFSCRWLRERHPAHSAKIHRVYNGIGSEAFLERNPAPGRPCLLSVGRCIEKKGFRDLIDACALLRDRGLDFECAIVGGGPLEESLRGRVAELHLQKIVTLAGPQPQEEVRRRLSNAHGFVLACATEPDGGMDNFPTVIIEAMAAGLPVVSTRLAAVPEMVEHGVSGLLVAEKQPESLADAMEIILRDPVKARQFGLCGKAAVTERFVVQVTAGELKNLLENAVSKRRE